MVDTLEHFRQLRSTIIVGGLRSLYGSWTEQRYGGQGAPRIGTRHDTPMW